MTPRRAAAPGETGGERMTAERGSRDQGSTPVSQPIADAATVAGIPTLRPRGVSRVAELMAMRHFARLGISARSTWQVLDGQYAELPWVRDVAQEHGYELVDLADERADEQRRQRDIAAQSPDVTDKRGVRTGSTRTTKTAKSRSCLPGVSRAAIRDTEPRKGICDRCGHEFALRRRDTRFCGDTCRQAAHRAVNLAGPALAIGVAP